MDSKGVIDRWICANEPDFGVIAGLEGGDNLKRCDIFQYKVGL